MQHKRQPARVYVEIEVSYRWRGPEPECAFVTLIEQRNQLHRRIMDTRHLTANGDVLRLIDEVNATIREWTLEHVLPEPF